jgi:methyltransferase (TIGR00027 family)
MFLDPFAQLFLGRLNRVLISLGRFAWVQSAVTAFYEWKFPGVMGEFVYRTRAIDAFLEELLGRESDLQIVILGAGFDTRALRLKGREKGRWFEVDHPATQALKARRLKAAGLESPAAFVAVDFQTRGLEALLDAGFKSDRPSVFVMEGVSYYLTEGALSATLRQITELGGAHARFLFNYLHADFLAEPLLFPGGMRIRRHVDEIGEPFRFGLRPEDLAPWLSARGFELQWEKSVEQYAGELLRGRRPVYGFSRMFRLAMAQYVVKA